MARRREARDGAALSQGARCEAMPFLVSFLCVRVAMVMLGGERVKVVECFWSQSKVARRRLTRVGYDECAAAAARAHTPKR